MSYRQFTEVEIKAIGGINTRDLGYPLPALAEMCELALETTPAFSAALSRGRGLRRWLESCIDACQNLRESNQEATLGFLLRKGLQSEGIGYYQTAEKTWPDYCGSAGSTTVAEWYAPVFDTTIPGPVENGDRYPVSEIIGEESVIRNIVFGQIIPIGRTLFDDDQTSQIRQFSSRMGSGMATLESVWASSRFFGAERTYANVTVPASSYTTRDANGNTVSGPFSTALGNRPAAYGQLTLPKLARAYVSLLNITDPNSNKLVIKPNKLLVSAMDAINGKVLLAPGPWPAIPGQGNLSGTNPPVAGGTSSTDGANLGVLAGYPGGYGSANPFSGMGISLVMERYLRDWAWALLESGKGFIFQTRDELEVVEESRNTGSYFDFDEIRYKSRKRFNIDWIGGGSRFAFAGNDGSVTGTL